MQQWNFNISTVPPLNPGRGLSTWRTVNFAPVQSFIEYQRFVWAKLESGTTINLKPLTDWIAAVKGKNKRYAFRIQTMIPKAGRGTPSGINGTTYPDGTFVPHWDDPVFQQRIANFYNALGTIINNDPWCAYIDIGIYGSYAEWHAYGYEPKASLSAKQFFIDLHCTTFPDRQLVMMTDDSDGLGYAMQRPTSLPIGLRRDSYGNGTNFPALFAKASWPLAQNRWQTAPFIVEVQPGINFNLLSDQVLQAHVSDIGNGNMQKPWEQYTATERDQWLQAASLAGYCYSLKSVTIDTDSLAIQTVIHNSGNAPTYDNWVLQWKLYRDTTLVAAWDSAINLKSCISGDATFNDTFPNSSLLSLGSYRLELEVKPLLVGYPRLTFANAQAITAMEFQVIVDDGSLTLQEQFDLLQLQYAALLSSKNTIQQQLTSAQNQLVIANQTITTLQNAAQQKDVQLEALATVLNGVSVSLATSKQTIDTVRATLEA